MPKILLVEDNEMNRDMLSRRLIRKGYQVVLALDGQSGVEMAESEAPDLILMDMSLPILDGWEATRRLKANQATQRIPVIGLTAHAMSSDREKALDAGCNDYDTKPVELSRLLGMIETLLGTPIDAVAEEPQGATTPLASDVTTLPLPAPLLHALRTSLNQIIGYSAMLLEQAHEEGQPTFLPDLKRTQSAGFELLTLINDNFRAIKASNPPTWTPQPEPQESIDLTKDSAPCKPVPAGSQGLILIVDDIEGNRDMLSRSLQRQGYVIAVAETGRQALSKIASAPFDLVLLDIVMPEMDGITVLKQLKADPALRHIPVIMMSALDELNAALHCIELGAEDYLQKPFYPTLLKARIGACLEKKRVQDRAAQLFENLQELTATLANQNAEMVRWKTSMEADLAAARDGQ